MLGFISRFVGGVCRCTNQCHTGSWCVAARWSPPRKHPTSRRSGSVLVELDLVEDLFCCAYCQQMLRLLFLHIRFPLLSIFLDSFVSISLHFVSSVSSGLKKSFISSSHLFSGLPTGLFVWCMVLRPGFHFAAFFAHRSSGSDAILIPKRHVILLCVSIQHGIFTAFILSTAVAVLLFTYSIHSSSSIWLVSISSPVSFMKEMWLSWSQYVFELLPSAASSPELLWFAFSSPSSSSFLLG